MIGLVKGLKMATRRIKAMNNHRKYQNKVPPFTPNPEHWTRKGHSWKAKVAYHTKDEAYDFLEHHTALIEKGYTCYQCHVCQKWHIGKRHNKSNEDT